MNACPLNFKQKYITTRELFLHPLKYSLSTPFPQTVLRPKLNSDPEPLSLVKPNTYPIHSYYTKSSLIIHGRTHMHFSGHPFLITHPLAFSANLFGPEITAIIKKINKTSPKPYAAGAVNCCACIPPLRDAKENVSNSIRGLTDATFSHNFFPSSNLPLSDKYRCSRPSS